MILHFPGQKEDEVVKYLVRKHWIIYVKLGFLVLAMIGLPLMLYFYAIAAIDMQENTRHGVSLLFLLYLQIVSLVTFIRWLEDELDLIIVTNERVISIDQVSFLHRTISETELSQIQDVKHVSKGVLSNIFGFGDLEVQTAAEKIVFCIRQVGKADWMARRIMDMCNTYKHEFATRHSGGPAMGVGPAGPVPPAAGSGPGWVVAPPGGDLKS